MQLREMKIGDKGRVTAIIKGEKSYRKRLISLGLLPGTEFQVNHIAPLGDPVEILVRGFSLSLRKDEASILKVEALR